jgi:threonine dehydratase
MQAITLDEIEAAARIVYAEMQATPQYCWPLLCERLGTEVWVKHENHTPIGSFKIRGGLVYFAHLAKSSEMPKGVVSATREIMGSLLVLLLGVTEFRLQS